MYLAVPMLFYGGEQIIRALRSGYKSVKIIKVLLIMLIVYFGFALISS